MPSAPVIHSLDSRGVATVTLNRPEVGNAYNGELIQGLLGAMDELAAHPELRALLLRGNGQHFQAGADLAWIRSVSRASAEENVAVSRATAEAVDRLNRLPIPTIALVQGGCFGGGTGIVAACDIVIAADNAIFSIAEVRWGLTAAIIIPQLSDAISVRQLRRYALTGERFGAAEAQRIGLAHQVVPARPPGGRRRGDDRARPRERARGDGRDQGPGAAVGLGRLRCRDVGRPRRQPRRQAPLTGGRRRSRLVRGKARSALVARLAPSAQHCSLMLGVEPLKPANGSPGGGARRPAPLTFAAMRT